MVLGKDGSQMHICFVFTLGNFRFFHQCLLSLNPLFCSRQNMRCVCGGARQSSHAPVIVIVNRDLDKEICKIPVQFAFIGICPSHHFLKLIGVFKTFFLAGGGREEFTGFVAHGCVQIILRKSQLVFHLVCLRTS